MKNCGTKQGTNPSATIPNKRRVASYVKWLVVVVVGLAAQAGAGIRTSSISFDGVNSYALFANPFFQGQTLTNWSVEMWFKTRNILGGNRASQELWGKSGFWKDVWITFETNGVIGCWYSYPSPETYWGVVSGAGVVKNLTWHHAAAVMNGTNLQFFVDGTNVASAVGNGLVNWAQDSGGASTGLNMLGQEQDGNFGTNDRFNGMISEFRLWNKALTQGEIQNNMNKQLVPGLHPELVGYWPMGQGSGSTVADFVSTNTLTLYANTGWTNDAPPISQIEGSGIPTNLLQGLVAYYPFNGNANDASGNGNNGTVYGATLTADRFGNPNAAYSFNGASAYITTPLTNTIFSGDFTASVWFNVSNLTHGWPALLDEQSEGFRLSLAGDDCGCSEPEHLVSYSDTAPGPSPANWSLVPPGQTPVNKFQQVVITKAGTNVQMYVNGQLAVTNRVANSTMAPGQYLFIGVQYDLTSYTFFPGVIDDIRIYNRALSSNEVAQLYAIESTPPCLPYTAAATATVVDGFVVAATITDGGCGYTNTPRVLIEGGGGTGAGATAAVSNGVVVGITITNAGTGYTSTPLVVIAPPFIPNPVLGIAPMSFLSFSNLTVGGVYQLQRSVGGIGPTSQSASRPQMPSTRRWSREWRAAEITGLRSIRSRPRRSPQQK